MKRKTPKEILTASFQELAAKKSIDKITIQEIVDNCGYSPATFYRHFKDKYDLIAWEHTRAVADIVDQVGADGYPWKQTLYDGACYNFPESQKIADGVYFIKAKGHTSGNSIIIVENEGLFYMLHGDITYMDEALYQNKLSVVFDDISAARETLDRVRDFVRNHPTVYCGTHTPQGYENLEAKRVIDLDNPVPTVLAEVDFSAQEASGKYVCSVCGYVYDPAEHDGVAFEDLPDDWKCPRCKQPKEKFNKA